MAPLPMLHEFHTRHGEGTERVRGQRKVERSSGGAHDAAEPRFSNSTVNMGASGPIWAFRDLSVRKRGQVAKSPESRQRCEPGRSWPRSCPAQLLEALVADAEVVSHLVQHGGPHLGHQFLG